MAQAYCPYCEQTVYAKRLFGVGTLIAMVLTGGFWLLLLLFYLKRCPMCYMPDMQEVRWHWHLPSPDEPPTGR